MENRFIRYLKDNENALNYVPLTDTETRCFLSVGQSGLVVSLAMNQPKT